MQGPCVQKLSVIRVDKLLAVKPATVSSAELTGMCSFNQKCVSLSMLSLGSEESRSLLV